MKKSMSLRVRLSIMILLITLIPLAGISIIGEVVSSNEVSMLAEENLENIAERLKDEIINEMDFYKQIAQVIAEYPDIVEATEEANVIAEEKGYVNMSTNVLEKQFKVRGNSMKINQHARYILLNQVKRINAIKEIFFTNRYGHNVEVSQMTSDFVQSDEEWWKDAMENGMGFEDVEYDDSAGIMGYTVYLPIPHPKTGVPNGIMKMFIDFSHLQNALDSVQIGDTGEAYLVNKDKMMISESRFKEELIEEGNIKKSAMLEIKADTYGVNQALNNQEGKSEYKDYRGEMIFGVYRSIPQYGWALLVEQDIDEINSSATTLLYIFLSLTGGFLIIALIASLIFSSRISKPITRLSEAAENLAYGDLDIEINSKRNDEIGKLEASLQKLAVSSKEMANVASEIAKGNVDVKVDQRSDKDVLGKSFNDMLSSWKKILDDMDKLYEYQKSGDYEYYIDEKPYTGSYSKMVAGVNESVRLHVNNILTILNIVSEYAEGKFEAKLQQLPGKQIIANQIMDKLRGNLLGIVEEMQKVINNSIEGKLDYRGLSDKYDGAFKDIVEGINQTLNAILEPIIKASAVLKKMSDGDLTENLTGEYSGDHAILQNSINKTLEGINNIVYQVSIAIEQVSNGSKQVSESSQMLSQGATEQASSLEEITSSLTEINSQAKQNLERIVKTNEITQETVSLGKEGNARLEQLTTSMEAINQSSDNIKKITKMIDDISFQINLLALNASVEAARAGKYGKGFAVVAEEVRNLAVRSADSVKESSAMVDEAIKNIEIINSLVDKTTEQFEKISGGAEESSNFLDDIVVATKEQSQAIDEIESALEQVDKVTQSNTANAEESASAAEELSSQSVHLSKIIKRFSINREMINEDMIEKENEALKTSFAKDKTEKKSAKEDNGSENHKKGPTGVDVVNPKDVISLDDDDFGNF